MLISTLLCYSTCDQLPTAVGRNKSIVPAALADDFNAKDEKPSAPEACLGGCFALPSQ